MIALIIMPFIDIIIVRYKLLGTYYERSGQEFMIIFSAMGAYVVRTSSLNDKLLSN